MIKEFFFHPLNIVELSQKKFVCVQEANFGKVAYFVLHISLCV